MSLFVLGFGLLLARGVRISYLMLASASMLTKQTTSDDIIITIQRTKK